MREDGRGVRPRQEEGQEGQGRLCEQKDPVTFEVKGYCEDTRFSIDINQDLADVVGYDFMDDQGGFDLTPKELSRKP